jgi:hypothetical protein
MATPAGLGHLGLEVVQEVLRVTLGRNVAAGSGFDGLLSLGDRLFLGLGDYSDEIELGQGRGGDSER